MSVHATEVRRSFFDRGFWPVGSFLLFAVAFLGLVASNGVTILLTPLGALVALPGLLASSWSFRLLSFAGVALNIGLIALAVWWVEKYSGV
jgi:hypothetical protein